MEVLPFEQDSRLFFLSTPNPNPKTVHALCLITHFCSFFLDRTNTFESTMSSAAFGSGSVCLTSCSRLPGDRKLKSGPRVTLGGAEAQRDAYNLHLPVPRVFRVGESSQGFTEIGRASCREKCMVQCRSRWSPYH